jgi:hypothetical protein
MGREHHQSSAYNMVYSTAAWPIKLECDGSFDNCFQSALDALEQCTGTVTRHDVMPQLISKCIAPASDGNIHGNQKVANNCPEAQDDV